MVVEGRAMDLRQHDSGFERTACEDATADVGFADANQTVERRAGRTGGGAPRRIGTVVAGHG
jgi:hypothetical protein